MTLNRLTEWLWFIADLLLSFAMLYLIYRRLRHDRDRRSRAVGVLQLTVLYAVLITIMLVIGSHQGGTTLFGALFYGLILSGFHVIIFGFLVFLLLASFGP